MLEHVRERSLKHPVERQFVTGVELGTGKGNANLSLYPRGCRKAADIISDGGHEAALVKVYWAQVKRQPAHSFNRARRQINGLRQLLTDFAIDFFSDVRSNHLEIEFQHH